jgi:hypothetical protein
LRPSRRSVVLRFDENAYGSAGRPLPTGYGCGSQADQATCQADGDVMLRPTGPQGWEHATRDGLLARPCIGGRANIEPGGSVAILNELSGARTPRDVSA